ncbi:MAG: hypothetical protein CSA81_02835 [Acidobacteria bacterium]|nr:MAG: hypothetical protein CSA81_02835 [Acidobacteriota bacterium]PIE89208.1 MAG: hypothetical protein CR997_12215 [Acidobacteriota bacterium]
MKQLRVSDELDSYCGKCKMDLAHSIVAMDGNKPVKVRCLTCQSEHKPRKKPGSSSTTRKRKTASKASSKKKPSAWLLSMEKWSDIDAVPYTISQTYLTGNFILHKKFGRGIVLKVPSPDMIIALFEVGEKMLLQGKTKR